MKKNYLESKVKTYGLRTLKTILLPIIMYAVLCIIAPENFFKWSTFVMLITQTIPYLAIGWAMVFGMSVGLFDFSVGATMILSGLIGVYFSQRYGLPGFVIACMVSSFVLTAITGLVYSILKIPSIITGFAALLVYESFGVILSKNMVNTINPAYLILGKKPYIYGVILIMFVIVYIVFNHTKFGYQIKAIGGDEHIAKSMGINTTKLKLLTYIVGGLFLGIATILMVSSDGTIQPKDNMTSMAKCFTPMMGVMIGMYLSSTNIIIGTFIGELCITMVSSGLVALNMESRLQNVFVGSFLIIFMALQINKDKFNLKGMFTKKYSY